MNRRDDQQIINAYLLGRLSNEEAERLDELSITDGEFAEALSVAENDLVDAYVNRELPQEDLKQFKSHYLATPSRRRKVELARDLQSVLERSLTGAKFTAVRESSGLSRFLSAINAAFTTPSPRLGLAAGLLVVVLFGTLLYFRGALPGSGPSELVRENTSAAVDLNSLSANVTGNQARSGTGNEQGPVDFNREPKTARPGDLNQRPVPERPKPTNQSVRPAIERRTSVALVLPPPVRGSELKTLRIRSGLDHAAITLQLEADDYKKYRVVLHRQGRNLWSSTPRLEKKAGQPSLTIRIPARLLTPQIYSISLSGIGTDGSAETIGDYHFRVVQ